MARITGIGGIFFKSPDPRALAAWYRDVLGFDIQEWGGALVNQAGAGRPPFAVWSPFQEDSDYFAPSHARHMINFAVDDMDAWVADLENKGVEVLGKNDDDPNGRFCWIVDPDGTKIEFWQPQSQL